MGLYQVFDHSPRGPAIALRDEAGRLHLARIESLVRTGPHDGSPSSMPAIGSAWFGAQAWPDLITMMLAPDGGLLRLRFEQLDCSTQASFEHLHPDAPKPR